MRLRFIAATAAVLTAVWIPAHGLDPFPVEVCVSSPTGGQVWARLAFKKGVQIQSRHLPVAFLTNAGNPDWVGFPELSPEGRRWLLQALWPADEWREDGVKHKVRWPRHESVWLLSQLFSGHGQNYDQLAQANPGRAEILQEGDVWVIPKDLLAEELGGKGRGVPERTQPEDGLDDEARVLAFRAQLTYGSDRKGHYAAYRLRKGEALYSSVVMRYTDRVDPRDVNELAAEIAQRSDIEDVRNIQPGALIKIPVVHLADPFQPEGTRALQEERNVRQEVRRTRKVDGGPRLKGVCIVLDPGHGGIDVGAKVNGVWESDFVFDIAMRTQKILLEETEAEVFSTIHCPKMVNPIRDRITSPCRDAELMTTPRIANDGEHPNAVSVHLRWVLANAKFAQAQTKGLDKTVFISLHADSLHPTARGTMAYVPGAGGVPRNFTLGVRRTLRVREARLGSAVRFTDRERLQGEARSRILAETILESLMKQRIPVHANRPIRNVIRRGRKNYVPAVIRHNRASAKILMEVANLANDADAENMKSSAFRQRYAEALAKGIRAYFGR